MDLMFQGRIVVQIGPKLSRRAMARMITGGDILESVMMRTTDDESPF